MHYIVFEGTSEDRRHLRGAPGLDVRGGTELEALLAGDVLWVVTRTEDDRGSPALCARLVVRRVLEHLPDQTGFASEQRDRTHRVQMEPRESVRCVPFPCEMVVAWDVWRRPFAGLSALNAEQGAALEEAWSEGKRKGADSPAR